MISGKRLATSGTSSLSSKSVLISVVMIAISCLGTSVLLTLIDHQSTAALNETVLTVFKMACGALIALLAQKRGH